MKTKIKLISSILAMLVLLSTVSLSAVYAKDVDAEQCRPSDESKYINEVVEKLNLADGEEIYNYGEIFEYYSTEDEATPDYVLVVASTNGLVPWICGDIFGDYYVRQFGEWNPYGLAFFVYVPRDDSLFTLREAYDGDIKGIEAVFTDFCLGELAGDVTGDRILNIKDATEIQKRIAGLSDYDITDPYDQSELYISYSLEIDGPLYLSDFNRDGKRDIKDATAIQKSIVNLA